MNWVECGCALLVAIISTIALTPVAKRLAFRLNAIDYPDARRVNTKPIPRMGGLAMFGGMIITGLVIALGCHFFKWINPFSSSMFMGVRFPLVICGVTIMVAVGLVDDVVNLQAKVKFLWQVVACCFVAASGLLLSNIQNPFVKGAFIEFGVFAYPITVFYLVAFANIINLIDGLDGLAAGISAISALTIFFFAVLVHRVESALLCIIIVGVCLGFLRYNHHPASIFMGDSGSLLLGLSLGIVSLFAVARSTLVVSLLVPIIVAGVPVTDAAVAIIRRKRAHQRVDTPDTGHIHHRLLRAGFSHQATVNIMWGWTAALAACSILLFETQGIFRIVVILIVAVISAYAVIKLHLLEPVLRHYYNPRAKQPQLDGPEEEIDTSAGAESSAGGMGESMAPSASDGAGDSSGAVTEDESRRGGDDVSQDEGPSQAQ
jgi:UDP-GlcNAc:undecaprenyl-phosphate GlcNAc-1-phosphate transferase